MSVVGSGGHQGASYRELVRKDEMHNSWEQLSPRPDVAVETEAMPSEGANDVDDESRPLISQKIEARRKGELTSSLDCVT